MTNKKPDKDNYLGALFGVAVGDALGGTLEFMNQSEIRRQYGILKNIIGGGVWNLKPGETTDDTAMTMAVARGILKSPEQPLSEIAGEFVSWIKTDPKDVGKIIKSSLSIGIESGAKSERDWQEAAESGHLQNGGKSAGNGSLMRTIPVALAYYSNGEKMREIARRQSGITHYDPLAGECCAYYCDMAVSLLSGKKLSQVLEESIIMAPFEARLDISPDELKSTGFVADTLQTAMACAYQTDTFEDALVMGVNLGGDADTVGAVLGGLIGAYYGYSKIPKRWVEKINNKKEIIELSYALFDLAIER